MNILRCKQTRPSSSEGAEGDLHTTARLDEGEEFMTAWWSLRSCVPGRDSSNPNSAFFFSENPQNQPTSVTLNHVFNRLYSASMTWIVSVDTRASLLCLDYFKKKRFDSSQKQQYSKENFPRLFNAWGAPILSHTHTKKTNTHANLFFFVETITVLRVARWCTG